MDQRKLIMIGLFPPPFSSGERILNELLYTIYSEEIPTTQINLSLKRLKPNNNPLLKISYLIMFTARFISQIPKIFSLRSQNPSHVFIISSNGFVGHLRDIILQLILYRKGQVWFTIIQNGNFEKVFQRQWHQPVTKRFFSRFDKVVLTSHGLKDRVAKYLPNHKLKVIYNSIDREMLTTPRVRESTNTPFTVLYLSNMNPTKGYMDLAEAYTLLPHELKGRVQVLFVGEWLSKQQELEFQEFLQHHGIEENITTYGKVDSRSKVKEIYQNSDLFVLPTYFPQEAQPVSIIEALNFGLPVISTYHASIPEFISDRHNGILVEKRSPAEIRNAIQAMLENESFYKELSINARKTFEQKFSPVVYKASVLKLIESDPKKNTE